VAPSLPPRPPRSTGPGRRQAIAREASGCCSFSREPSGSRPRQTFNRLDYFLETELLGEHHLQLKHRFYTEKEVRRQAQPGDYFDEHSDPDLPVARTTFYANDPHFDTGRSGWWIGTTVGYRSNASVGDTWRPTRHLTFTAAVSHIWSRGENSASAAVLADTTWAPSVAGVWDATHDGRTAVRGSHSQYVDADVRTPIMHTIGAQASRRCLWNPTAQSYDQDCVQSGGLSRNTVGSPCGPTGLDDAGQPCLQRLTLPRTREYTLGVEREVLPAVGLSLDLIYRAFGNRYELRETNRIWNPSGTAVLGYRNGRPETVIDVDTPGSARGTYRGMTLALDRRQGRLKTAFSYTLSDLRGTAFWGTSDPFLITPGVPAEGPEADDRRHAVKASAAWAASAWLSIGLRYQYGSGFPVDPFYRSEVTGIYERNLRDLRTPAAQALDLQVRFMLAPAAGHRLDLYAEALGLLNVRRPIDDASIFGGDTTGTPLRLRFGVSYRL
jgi:hypothetical protein